MGVGLLMSDMCARCPPVARARQQGRVYVTCAERALLAQPRLTRLSITGASAAALESLHIVVEEQCSLACSQRALDAQPESKGVSMTYLRARQCWRAWTWCTRWRRWARPAARPSRRWSSPTRASSPRPTPPEQPTSTATVFRSHYQLGRASRDGHRLSRTCLLRDCRTVIACLGRARPARGAA